MKNSYTKYDYFIEKNGGRKSLGRVAREIDQWRIEFDDREFEEQEAQRKEARRIERQAERVAFLGAAAAIPLFKDIYAGWIVDYLRAGGKVYRSAQPYPANDPWAKPDYTQPGVWHLTNTETKASNLPLSTKEDPLHVFVGVGLDRFRRQFGMKTATARAEPEGKQRRFARKPHAVIVPGLPGPTTNQMQTYGETTIFMAPHVGLYDGELSLPFVNKPTAACLYEDIDPIVRSMCTSDGFMQHLLDEVDVNGINKTIATPHLLK